MKAIVTAAVYRGSEHKVEEHELTAQSDTTTLTSLAKGVLFSIHCKNPSDRVDRVELLNVEFYSENAPSAESTYVAFPSVTVFYKVFQKDIIVPAGTTVKELRNREDLRDFRISSQAKAYIGRDLVKEDFPITQDCGIEFIVHLVDDDGNFNPLRAFL